MKRKLMILTFLFTSIISVNSFAQSVNDVITIQDVPQVNNALTDVTSDVADLFSKNVILGIGSKKMYIDSQVKIIDVSPMVIQERTLVPIRVIAEAFNVKVDFDSVQKKAIISTEGTVIEIIVNENYILKNNEILNLDVPAIIYENRMMLPLRKLTELLDKNVHYYNGVIVIGDKVYFDKDSMNKISKYVLPITYGQSYIADFIDIKNGWIIFNRNNTYCKVKLGKQEFYKIDLLTENIYENVSAHELSKQKQINEGFISVNNSKYFISDEDGFFYKQTGDIKKMILQQYVVDFDIVNGYIYFNILGDNALYKVDLNGQGFYKIIS